MTLNSVFRPHQTSPRHYQPMNLLAHSGADRGPEREDEFSVPVLRQCSVDVSCARTLIGGWVHPKSAASLVPLAFVKDEVGASRKHRTGAKVACRSFEPSEPGVLAGPSWGSEERTVDHGI